MKKLLNQRGQSLIEVTVALSLLTLVLTGVVTLAVSAVSLMGSSRMRMSGVAYVQQGLEIVKGNKGNSCTELVDGDYIVNSDDKLEGGSTQDLGGSFARVINVADHGITGLSSDYALATVTVSWDYKNSTDNIAAKQIIKRK